MVAPKKLFASARYVCPQCGGANLAVLVKTFADLDQSNPKLLTTDANSDTHEWELTGPMRCKDCQFINYAPNFANTRVRQIMRGA